MTHVSHLDGFDHALDVALAEGEITLKSDQANVEIALTVESAAETGRRLIAAAEQARLAKGKVSSGEAEKTD